LKSNIPGYIRGRIERGVSTPEGVELDFTNNRYSTPPVLSPKKNQQTMDVTMDIGIRRLWRQRNARKIHTCKRCYGADIQEIPHFVRNDSHGMKEA
jgi:hypothetical protein